MYQFSDSDSSNSDNGIRFKTENVRNRNLSRSRSRSRSPNKKSPKSKNSFNRNELTDGSNDGYKAEESEIFGPTLPPHLSSKIPMENSDISKISSEYSNISPDHTASTLNETNVLQPQLGPALPPQMLKEEYKEESVSEESRCIGPSLPAHLREKLAASQQDYVEEEDEEDVYGPLPTNVIGKSKAHIALEERALQMKLDQLNPKNDDRTSREEWMLELPELRANFGLGPRQFRPQAGPDLSNRSSWTETPKDKAGKLSNKTESKVDLKKEAELAELQKRDKEQERIIKKHKKSKSKRSLLEMHQETLKKKKEMNQEPSVRRPFSRDVDLKVNHFDEAQKKAVLKKAQLLDNRFSRGQSKFL